MTDIRYGYGTYLHYWGGMQIDSEILFTNKCPTMVKERGHFENSLLRGHYIVVKVPKMSITANT